MSLMDQACLSSTWSSRFANSHFRATVLYGDSFLWPIREQTCGGRCCSCRSANGINSTCEEYPVSLAPGAQWLVVLRFSDKPSFSDIHLECPTFLALHVPLASGSRLFGPEKYKKFQCSGLWLHEKCFVYSAILGATGTRSCDSPRRLFRISRISYVKMYSGRLSWTLFSLVASRAVTDRCLFRLRSTCLNCRWAFLRSLRLQCKSRVPQLCHLRRLFGCISHFST